MKVNKEMQNFMVRNVMEAFIGKKCIFCRFEFKTVQQMIDKKMTFIEKGSEYVACKGCLVKNNKRISIKLKEKNDNK